MKINKQTKYLISVGLVILIIFFAFWLSQQVATNEYLQNVLLRYGYAGVFIAAFISGFNLIVPIPAVAFVPSLISSGLDYWPSIIFLTLGMTLADIVAYVLGRAGRGVFTNFDHDKTIKKLEKLKAKHGWLPMIVVFFFASIAPVPNEILVIPLGFLRYRIEYILCAVFAGNLIFNTLYSKGIIELFKIF